MSRGGWCRLVAAAAALLLGGAPGAQPADGPGAAPLVTGDRPATLTVGALTLHRCQSAAPWCGSLSRPLDPTGAVPGMVSVYFEFFPHLSAGSPAQGTLVATEGGPGYPATDSREEYLQLFDPLRSTRDVVLMDNRGTGRSGAVNCRSLQTAPQLTEQNIGACGRTLGRSAGLYSSALAADDLAAILAALGAKPIDLYGDSYGTFFAQIFAVRHPGQLRSLILDGAYPLEGADYPWYPQYAPAMRAKFDRVCERSACRHVPGSSMEHIRPALLAVRAHPASVQAADGDGRLHRFTADSGHLATVMFGSAPAYATLRETDAAARAYVQGDPAPLLRLMIEAQTSTDSRDEARSPRAFSSGLAAAVTCTDAPQIFDMSYPVPRRLALRDAAIAERMRTYPDTYAPFTADEYRSMPLDYAFIDACVRWPPIAAAGLRQMAALRSSAYPPVPALVLSGDLDNMTPLADSEQVARRFPHGHHVIVPNGMHVNALAHSRSACPATIVRHFIQALEPGDTSCLSGVPEVRVLPAFARTSETVEAAAPLAGNEASVPQLKAAAAVVLTLGDALDRRGSNRTGHAVGLRGGSCEIAYDGENGASRITLSALKWTNDLAVSGLIHHPGRNGAAHAQVTVAGAPELSGELQVSWEEGIVHSMARIEGHLNGRLLRAEAAAP